MSELEKEIPFSNEKSDPDKIDFFKKALEETTNEVRNDEKEEKETENQKTEVLTDPEVEQATKDGWTPNKEDFEKKTGKRWIPAEEFNRNKSFFKKIDSLKHEINEQKQFIQKQMEHMQYVEALAYERALKDIQKQKLNAVEEGDIRAYHELEAQALAKQEEYYNLQKLRDIEAHKAQEQYQQQQTALNYEQLTPAAKAFYDRNSSWLSGETEKSKEMMMEASSERDILTRMYPQMPEKELFSRIEEKIKRLHPEQFTNSKQMDPSPVATKVDKTGNSKRLANYIPAKYQSAAKELINRGVYSSMEEYAKDLQNRGLLNENR